MPEEKKEKVEPPEDVKALVKLWKKEEKKA